MALNVVFLHPIADARGGGELVLWTAVQGVLEANPNSTCRVYTRPSNGLLKSVETTFGLRLDRSRIELCFCDSRVLERARTFPCTLFAEAIAALLWTIWALWLSPACLVADTYGLCFGYLFLKLKGCRIVNYTHYPAISGEMRKSVPLKRAYYFLYSILYRLCARQADRVLVNSTWTKNHIDALWKMNSTIVYPPCRLHSCSTQKANIVLSIAQFRPEKNHLLQIRAFAAAVNRLPSDTRFLMVGGCRDALDMERVGHLRDEIENAGLGDRIEVRVNLDREQLEQLLRSAKAGLHTMANEHFGIGVVEYMAFGCIPIAHRSGGPLMDIVVPLDGQQTGYLAESAAEFADCLVAVLTTNHTAMQAACAKSALRFSDSEFIKNFTHTLYSLYN